MYRRLTLYSTRRLYHDSRFKKQDPVVQVANKRVSNELKKRAHADVRTKITNYDPSRQFEPFPFAVTEENRLEILRKTTTPLAALTYKEQLESKESHCRNTIRYIAQQLYKVSTPIRLDVRRLPCPVNNVVKAPQLYQYRNKDEFSIWRGIDGKTNTVGYMAFPISKHGDTVALDPNGCEIMKEESLKLVEILQDFIRNHAKLSVCFNLGEEGGWRRFSIRNNIQGDLMLIGVVNPRTLRVREIIDERENFREFIVTKTKEAGLSLKSLYFQPCPHNSCSNKQVPFELLHGERTIVETFNQFKFAISPESFFPQNTSGGEILFKTLLRNIEECFEINAKSTYKPLVININCGAGVAAINLTDAAMKVVGIDTSEQAIDDAIFNALMNEVEKKCEFISANVEIVLERVLEKYNKLTKDVMVVCTIQKKGLHRNVIHTLLECMSVKKLIIMTPKIDANAVVDNIVELCSKRPGKSPPPFAPILATPVDTYPHCENYDTILVLERLP